MFTRKKVLPPQHSSQPDIPALEWEETELFDALLRSIPQEERDRILAELDNGEITERANLLCQELSSNQLIVNIKDSRTLFLAALRSFKHQQITLAQLTTLHLVDSAIRMLHVNPMSYLVYKHVDPDYDHGMASVYHSFNLRNLSNMPRSVSRAAYDSLIVPREGMAVSELPFRMQLPLMKRFFNFSVSEWKQFCGEMARAPLSEQYFYILNAPEHGCWSNIIFHIQKVVTCMRILDRLVETRQGFEIENIMLVPSFSMFQAAMNAKAHTLGRKPIELIPTYGRIDSEQNATLKSHGKIALAIYLPEKNMFEMGKSNFNQFRTTTNGLPGETAFAGAIYDVYCAMREMAMSEHVVKARMRLASIAKQHPLNKLGPNSRAVNEILIDGDLIHSWSPTVDTVFDPGWRPACAQSFGDIFYSYPLKQVLHKDLKYVFIEDMVNNKKMWKREFNIDRSDLRKEDQDIYDEVGFSAVHAINEIGLLANNTWRTSLSPQKRDEVSIGSESYFPASG